MPRTQVFRMERRARNRPDKSKGRSTTNFTAVLSVVATKLRVTLNGNATIQGLPHVAASGGAHAGTAYPTSITQISQNVFDLDYLANVAAGDAIVYPANDPGLRSYNGGYVLSQAVEL